MATRSDIRFAREVLAKGFASKSLVAGCLLALRLLSKEGMKKHLSQLMLEEGFLTEAQVKAVQEAEKSALVGKRIGRFQILSSLGSGGMGSVYKAEHLGLDRTVALKVLPDSLASDGEYVERFLLEARAVAQLVHENIVQVYDVGRASGIYYMAMEFVDGSSLIELLEEGTPLPVLRALTITAQVARALDVAYEHDIVHRDIKPENILLSRDGKVKLADLGLAKRRTEEELGGITTAGIALGTPFYMAPEQARDATSADHRSDIYSLGCSLYEMLTGQVPFKGKSLYDILRKHETEKPTPIRELNPLVPEPVRRLVERMMAKDPADRYQTPKELLEDINILLRSKTIRRLSKKRKRPGLLRRIFRRGKRKYR